MRQVAIWECLDCGMLLSAADSHCLKCDDALAAQTGGQVVRRDIAHQGETVSEAEDKLAALLRQATLERWAGLEVIVGGGLIKDAILGKVAWLERRGEVRRYQIASHNPGMIYVTLRGNPDF